MLHVDRSTEQNIDNALQSVRECLDSLRRDHVIFCSLSSVWRLIVKFMLEAPSVEVCRDVRRFDDDC